MHRHARTVVSGLAILIAVGCGRSKRDAEVPGAGNGGDTGGEPGGDGGDSSRAGRGANGGRSSGEAGDAPGGEPGTAGEGASGGELGEQDCSLEPIAGEADYAFDASVVSLHLDVELNGEPLPDSPNQKSRAVILARERATGSVQSFDLGASGPAAVDAPLFVGRYDFYFSLLEPGVVEGIEPPAVTAIALDLSVESNSNGWVALETVSVAGSVRVNGAPLPDHPNGSSWGTVELRDPQSGDRRAVELGASGEPTYRAVVFAGQYDVLFQSGDAAQTALPYSAQTLVTENALLTEDAELNLDLRVVEAGVTLTSNGEELPDSDDAFRGLVSFRDRLTGTVYKFDAGAAGPAAFTARLFESEYDITFTTGGEVRAPFPPFAMTSLGRAVRIADGDELRFDVQPVAVSGSVRVNGGSLGDDSAGYSRGSVDFRDRVTGKVYDFEVGASGDALYSGSLFAGDYDVRFTSAPSPPERLPAGGSLRLSTALAIRNDQSVDYDLPVVNVHGALTLDGVELPDSPGATTRGALGFRDLETSHVQSFDLGSTGPGAYAGRLFAGTYDVVFQSSAEALEGLPESSSAHLAGNAAFTRDAEANFELGPVTISGAVGVNGGTMPDSPSAKTRGALVLRDKFTNVSRSFDIGATGEASFSALVFAGSYDAALQTADAELVGLPRAASTLLARGCVARGPCQAGSDDLGGHWTFVFDVAGFGPLSADITDHGDGTLAGLFVTPTDSGEFTGVRAENTFSLSADLGTSGCSPLVLHGTLFDACGVSGYAECGGFSSYSPRFTGVR